MIKRACMLALAIALMAQPAQAQRIRDLSLSPEETMREPDIVRGNQGYYGGNSSSAIANGYTNQPGASGSVPSAHMLSQQQYFVASYCNNKTQPIVQSPKLRSLTGCTADIEKQGCARFAQLPEDARYVVDNVTNCLFEAAQSATDEAVELACRDALAQQVRVVKRYWDKPDTAYSILFVPDMLTNAGSFCNRTGGRL